MKAVIRSMQPEEFPQLRDFLYLSIFVHQGEAPPDRSVLDTPAFQVYLEGFGARPGDCAVVAEVDGVLAGAAWGASWRTTAMWMTRPPPWPFPSSRSTGAKPGHGAAGGPCSKSWGN